MSAICFINCYYLPLPFPWDTDSRKGKICSFCAPIHKKKKKKKKKKKRSESGGRSWQKKMKVRRIEKIMKMKESRR